MTNSPDYLKPISIYQGSGIIGDTSYEEAQISIRPFTEAELGRYPYPLLIHEMEDRIGFWKSGEKPRGYHGYYLMKKYPDFYEQAPVDSLNLAIVILEYRDKKALVARSNTVLEQEDQEYTLAKRAIWEGQGSQNKKQRRVDQLAQERSQKKADLVLEHQVNTNLLNASVDIFIQKILLSGGIDGLPIAVEDLRNNTDIAEEEVVELLEVAIDRISRKNLSGEELAQIWYKRDANILFTRSSLEQFSQILKLQFDDSVTTDPIVKLTRTFSQRVCKLYFDRHREMAGEDRFPFMTLINDYISAAAYTNNLRILNTSLIWFFKNLLASDRITDAFMVQLLNSSKEAYTEGEKLAQDVLDEYGYSYKEDNLFSVITTLQTSEQFAQRVSSFERGAVISRLVDINLAMASIIEYIQFIQPGTMAKLFQKCSSQTMAEYLLVSERVAGEARQNALLTWRTIATTRNPELRFLTPLLENISPKQFYLTNIASLYNTTDIEIGKKAFWGQRLMDQRFSELHADTGLIISTDNALHAMFIEKSPISIDEVAALQKESHELIRRIVLTRKWFVYKTGDPFIADEIGNEELLDYSIQSMTFYPAPQFKGGHRVFIQTSVPFYDGSNFAFTVFIDQNGQLYYENETPFNLSINVAEPFRKLLLERLEFITSARASVATGPHLSRRDMGEQSESVKRTTRGVFAVLTSTPDRVITLKSKHAVQHNEILKRDYGIDKHTETANRRRAKRLGLKGGIEENQWITFQRETGNRSRNHRLYFTRKQK